MKRVLFSALLVGIIGVQAVPATEAGDDEHVRITRAALDGKEVQLNDDYFIKIRLISKDEFTLKQKESTRLGHKPYEKIEDISKVQKILGNNFKVFTEFEKSVGGDITFELTTYEMTFKDGTKKRFGQKDEIGFIAYYPEVEVMLFEGGHTSDYSVDLNDSTKVSERVGNPSRYSVSPDKKFRLNGYHTGQGYYVNFLEKWNPLKKKYEFIGNLDEDFDYTWPWFWSNNHKAISWDYFFENVYYEIEIVRK